MSPKAKIKERVGEMCFDITDVFHSQASVIRWKLFWQSVLEGKTHIVEVWLNNEKYEATSMEYK